MPSSSACCLILDHTFQLTVMVWFYLPMIVDHISNMTLGLPMVPFPMARFFVFSVVLFQAFSAAASHSTVKSLPGLPDPLPFVFETGYVGVGVGDLEDAQLFYYFVKSEGNPSTDPLILWFTGGPGCSALSAFAFGIGPLIFKEDEGFNSSVPPRLILSPNSWTKKSSIIFIDLPVGTGFSYATTPQALETGDSGQVHHAHQFLRKWLLDHPEFISNPFYVGGDSYSGFIVPAVAQKISEDNERGLPFINLQGYILGNPLTIRNSYKNFAIPYAHRMTLISDELFESLTTSCRGNYVNIDPSNVECLKYYDTYQKCISKVFDGHILLPTCPTLPSVDMFGRRSLSDTLDPTPPLPPMGCSTRKYTLSYYWANNDQIRKALHIRKGSIGEWLRCDRREDYKYDIDTALPHHLNLSSKGYRSLIYSGDHDLGVSHLDTQAWIKSLNYSFVEEWRPWFIIDQVAGYTKTYANNMTFATIKGGGHTVEYTPKECSIMFSRWISGKSL